jgi:hypothetical protein
MPEPIDIILFLYDYVDRGRPKKGRIFELL